MKSIIDSPIGPLAITTDQEALTQLCFASTTELQHDQQSQTNNLNETIIPTLHKHVISELAHYFKHSNLASNQRFSVPIKLEGTQFQQRVWQALQNIPAGETLTYGELAKKLNTGPRAIGAACRTNPIPVIIPCHRVISKQGIGGFYGKTSGTFLNIKAWLLQHEGAL
ncbi:cysteine methyltransferase [Piscirickettsia salmonis]|uniref:methylated-DNA--[protein]-cysteine S-methyltransferase n=1 Tax=Piscirickettsia salmonis TaxID=1238 RepID=A0A9Q6LLD7_PISSA|nr:methylated-DNA--[protein]-cysteine S-methyltransferase [Piscirickettsia salmonis]RNC78093.1 methylated-DNA--[protein]-cysteine S-methyltransferase [Piscirickettsiaceae bacterium NZ-RLO2]ALA25916.1 methylated-DNA-[]-cysteine S-methyltransferase family protein [Piscirickettsia salmonis]APS43387.1 cysteine methyltransferase [Piscirickettsia salmonis]APS46738.1 cysteine methyltransferase [Piscirickettsia salmonis]APS50711.1 cysteine methyltransferase [Piscirickettsia salmonis]